jgi:uncharacterized C2H2 Zn-finger protein
MCSDWVLLLDVKWNNKNFDVTARKEDTIKDVKRQLQYLTNVSANHMKLVGLTKGKSPDDNTKLSQLNLKNPTKVMMIGTVQTEIDKMAVEEMVLHDRMEIERALEDERERRRREEEERREKEEQARRERLAEDRRRWQEEMRRRQEEMRDDMERRRAQFIDDQNRMEIDPTASVELHIQCHSIAFSNHGPKPNFEISDKIVLPHTVLEEVVNNRLELPLTFRISTKSSQHITHAGVLDFTAPSNTAYLPFWMMQKLGLDEGDEIDLKTVKLPKGEFVKLKPMNDNWADIPTRELLEYQLRNYQSLTTNDVIKVNHKGQTYDLHVVSVRPVGRNGAENSVEISIAENEGELPEMGVSILDTDLNVDIEGIKTGVEHVELELGEEKEVSLQQGEYGYFTIVLPEFQNGSFVIEIQTISGDADLYLSTKERYPSQKSFIWASQQKGSKRLVLSPDDPKFSPGRYFIGVHAFGGDAKFILTITLRDKEGQTLGGTSDQAGASETKICSNCRRAVPVGAILLHEAQCARRNFRCPQCGEVMPLDQKDKHLSVAHALLKCECGKEFEQDVLPLHKEYECPRRGVKCVYCGLVLPYEEKGPHQFECGSRTAKCPHCDKIHKRRDMKTHIVEAHNIYPENEEFF